MTEKEAVREVGEAIDYMIEIFPKTSKIARAERWGDIMLFVTTQDGSHFGITCSPLNPEELK